VRAFLAVPPDPEWVDGVREWIGRIRGSFPPASWTRPETWHLTLRFFAEISEESAGSLAASVGREADSVSGGDLAVAAAVVLPPRGRPRVLGVGFRPCPVLEALASLAASLEEAARTLGLEPEERPFHPHVTFARMRVPWPAPAVTAFRREVEVWAFPPYGARAIVFYRSRLEAAGAVHMPLHEWRLAKPSTGAGA
jgi:2'-5' RNA ligase